MSISTHGNSDIEIKSSPPQQSHVHISNCTVLSRFSNSHIFITALNLHYLPLQSFETCLPCKHRALQGCALTRQHCDAAVRHHQTRRELLYCASKLLSSCRLEVRACGLFAIPAQQCTSNEYSSLEAQERLNGCATDEVSHL